MSFNNSVTLCEVVFPYAGLNSDELTLRVGQFVTIISKEVDDAGWWKGEVDGAVGVFPENFVKVIENSDKKPERPPPPTRTLSNANDTEKVRRLKKTISVEEKYDLDSLRKELQETTFTRNKTEVPIKSDDDIPAIHITDEKKSGKEGSEMPESFGEPSSSKLSHTTVGRVRPPKRRPPSQHFLKENIPEDIILEVEEEEKSKEKEKDTKRSPIKVPQINLLDITQVKLRDSSKTAKLQIKSSSPTPGGKPSWLAELSQKQAKRKSVDVLEEPKKEKSISRSKSEYTSKSGESTTTEPIDAVNLGWDKRLLDTNKNLVENKDTVKEVTSSEVASLKILINQIKNDAQDQLSQLRSEIEKEREARIALEKEVQILKKKSES